MVTGTKKMNQPLSNYRDFFYSLPIFCEFLSKKYFFSEGNALADFCFFPNSSVVFLGTGGIFLWSARPPSIPECIPPPVSTRPPLVCCPTLFKSARASGPVRLAPRRLRYDVAHQQGMARDGIYDVSPLKSSLFVIPG